MSFPISALGEEHEGGMQVPRRVGVLRAEDVLAERRPLQSGEYSPGELHVRFGDPLRNYTGKVHATSQHDSFARCWLEGRRFDYHFNVCAAH